MRLSVAGAALAVSLAMLATAASAPAATAPAPGWQLLAATGPTNLAPESTGQIAVLPFNTGAATSAGEVTLSVGPLPAGISFGEAEFHEGSWVCEEIAGKFVCKTSESVEALHPMPSLVVGVQVGPGAEGGEVKAQIEGGGAGASASRSFPLTISGQPAEAGIASFFSESFDAGGRPSTQAGGHPYSQQTAFIVNTVRSSKGVIVPAGSLRDLSVDLPPGFAGNPLSTPRCPQGFLAPQQFVEPVPICYQPDYRIGTLYPAVQSFGGIISAQSFGIFNDIPAAGAAAQFATKIAVVSAGLVATLRSEEDFGVRITSPNTNSLTELTYGAYTVVEGAPEGGEGKAFLRNPTDCAEQARQAPVVGMSASSWQEPGVFDEQEEPQAPVTGCAKLATAPEFSFQPSSDAGSSVAGATAHLHLDQSSLSDPEALAAADLKRSVVKLPAGFDVNPSQANGLEACTEAQVGYLGTGALPNPTRFDNAPVSCPDASKLGSAEATSPLLEEALQGTIYLAKQDENPFGSLLALYLVFESPRFGITLKLPGRVDLDPHSGQATATFDHLPQQPVEDLTLRFRGGGPRSEFATPEVCGKYTTTGAWEPWSAPESGPAAQTTDSFTVSSGCSASAGARPFHPSFEAGAVDPLAASYSPLVVKVKRADGEGELKRLDFTMPPGVAAKLAGVPYCPGSAIAAARSKTGHEEQASPSCPDASKLGTTDAAAGAGPDPFHAPGTIYLAGPYKSAPLSAVVITPAVAGPFDLGDVVIRSPLHIDPVSAQVTAKSDPIPTILDGIPLKLREVTVKIDRDQFAFNPSSCEAMQVSASIGSSDGALATPDNRFQVGGCAKLAFKPHMTLRLSGATKRTGHPKLIAQVFSQGLGVADLARVQTRLPSSAFLDQAHIRTICTRVQWAAGAGNGASCPKGSIYGRVWVKSPIVDYWLAGDVYLRSSNHNLPDLVLALNGPDWQPVAVELSGKTDSVRGALRNTFEAVPDAPFTKARLVLFGGHRGLVVNSRDLCTQSKRARRANVRLVGQNGKTEQLHPLVGNSCGKAKKKRHGEHHHKRGGK